MTGPSTFPFSAIVGQERLKLSLILNAVHPGIGGLLIRGPKGTGKSTAVYALASLLPDRTVITHCPYGCTPESDTFIENDSAIRTNIEEARTNLPRVSLPEYQLEAVAEMCIVLNIDGQRLEIAISHTAMTMAAYHKRQTVEEADLHEACIFALSHRTRDGGFEPPATPDEITEALTKALKQKESHKDTNQGIQMAANPTTTSEKKSPESFKNSLCQPEI